MIRDFTLFTAVGAVIAYVTIQNSSIAPTVVVARLETVGALAYAQWTGRVVVPAGGFIAVVEGGPSSGTEVYVGGYLLRSS